VSPRGIEFCVREANLDAFTRPVDGKPAHSGSRQVVGQLVLSEHAVHQLPDTFSRRNTVAGAPRLPV
jgi:hypothetical protein